MRVVREDPLRQGQLYAGTEGGMFVSFDDGANWYPFDLNLPPVPITDLAIRHDNLVAATQGRGFWVLDDLFMAREAATGIGQDPVQVFTADETVLLRSRGWSSEEFEAPNPEYGVRVFYHLDEGVEEEDDPLSIEIFNSEGNLVRSFSSAESERERCLLQNSDPRNPYKPKYPSARKGLNQWNWRGDRKGFTCVNDITIFYGLHGPGVMPGEYTVRVSAGGHSDEVSFQLKADPRRQASAEDTAEWAARINETAAMLENVLNGLGSLRHSQAQVEDLMANHPADAQLQQS